MARPKRMFLYAYNNLILNKVFLPFWVRLFVQYTIKHVQRLVIVSHLDVTRTCVHFILMSFAKNATFFYILHLQEKSWCVFVMMFFHVQSFATLHVINISYHVCYQAKYNIAAPTFQKYRAQKYQEESVWHLCFTLQSTLLWLLISVIIITQMNYVKESYFESK